MDDETEALGLGPYCPHPLVPPPPGEKYNTFSYIYQNSSSTMDTGCTLACENVTYTQDEWDLVGLLIAIYANAGLFSSIFVLATWLTDGRKRRAQGRVIHFAFSTFLVSLGFCLVEISGRESTWCHDNIRRTPASSLCIAQGSSLVSFLLSSVFWWFFIALDTYTHMFPGHLLKTLNGFHHTITLISYGIPIFLASVAVKASKIERSEADMFTCFINNDNNSMYQNVLFYYPLMAVTSCGTVLFMRILGFVIRHLRASQRSLTREAALDYRYSALRISGFLFSGLFQSLVWLVARYVAGSNAVVYEESVDVWLACLHYSMKRGGDYYAECGERPEERLHLALTHLRLMVTAGCGLGTFLVYGAKRENVTHWKGLLQDGITRVARGGSNSSSCNNETITITKNVGYQQHARTWTSSTDGTLDEHGGQEDGVPSYDQSSYDDQSYLYTG